MSVIGHALFYHMIVTEGKICLVIFRTFEVLGTAAVAVQTRMESEIWYAQRVLRRFFYTAQANLEGNLGHLLTILDDKVKSLWLAYLASSSQRYAGRACYILYRCYQFLLQKHAVLLYCLRLLQAPLAVAFQLDEEIASVAIWVPYALIMLAIFYQLRRLITWIFHFFHTVVHILYLLLTIPWYLFPE